MSGKNVAWFMVALVATLMGVSILMAAVSESRFNGGVGLGLFLCFYGAYRAGRKAVERA
jgi:uncharacterized membrane protein